MLSFDADVWPLSICRYSPLLPSQILTVLSPDADASRLKSGEKVTELTLPLWPTGVGRQALYLSLISGFIVIVFGSSSSKRPLVKLRAEPEEKLLFSMSGEDN
jgi:hypothetical protein